MSFLSHLNPIPSFPAASGPYSVGTQDVEIPVSELSSSISPDPQISTISFRLFYPCEREHKKTKPVYWLPEPQGDYLRAYYRFMQASPWLASLLSYIPLFRIVNHTTIVAARDVGLFQPPPRNEGRWPVMIFSHGLGGSKNAYSHICGSLASHGLVVVAPDHRDGSAPLSVIKESGKSERKYINYRSLPHNPTPEVEEGRNLQLKIRCSELGLIHEALLKIDKGDGLQNTHATKPTDVNMAAFASRLDVHHPGKISWVGHSFGATTIFQFIKSVFYGGSPLFTTPGSSALSKQITPSSPISLLDIWTLPLLFKSTSSLWSKPLPAYSAPTTTFSPSAPLTILSEGFYKWTSNLRTTIRAVSPSSPSDIKPYIFYPIASAHLSQSDFGLLFPWITKKVMKAEEPERTLKLNVRAILESLRRVGICVADTSSVDREMEGDTEGGGQDGMILESTGKVRGWVAIDPKKKMARLGTDGEATNGHAKESATNGHVLNGHATNGHAMEPKGPAEAVMQNEVMK